MKPYYDHGGVTLYVGDCRNVLPSVAADVLVTDPPYGIKAQLEYARGGGSGLSPWAYQQIVGDEDTAIRDEVLAWWGNRPALVFGSWKATKPAGARAMLIWDKGPQAGQGDLALPWKPNWEAIYVLGHGFTGRRDSSIITGGIVSWTSQGRLHQHQKPLGLIAKLIDKCPPGTVLDPFAGSGTTLVAARDAGRPAIGVEIDERCCEIIARRLDQLVLGGAS